MSSPKQSSEPQDLIHRDSSSASSLHQISSQLLSGQTRKFSRLSAPKPRHEMPPAFLQVTLYSFLFWQEHLRAWSAKRQKYFCFLNQPTNQPNLPENCSLSPNNCFQVAHQEDKRHKIPEPVRQCDLTSPTYITPTMKTWILRRNLVTPSSSTYHRPVSKVCTYLAVKPVKRHIFSCFCLDLGSIFPCAQGLKEQAVSSIWFFFIRNY